MMRQAMQVAQEIMRRDEQDQKAVAVVTYEQCQEELENFIQSNQTFSSTDVAWGRVPEDQLIQQVKNRADLPLWVIGHSMARAGTKKPAMTPETVLDAIKYIQDKHQRQVVLMTFDYVQLIPVTGGGSKTEQVTAAVPMIKNLALEIGAPAIIAVQASRDVDSLKFKIPQMHHAQWASIIEQACDKVFSFWRPWQTEEQGATINLGPTYGNEQPVSANLLIVAMLKQRFGLGHKIWPMYFDPAYLKLAQMEFYHGDLLEDDEYGV